MKKLLLAMTLTTPALASAAPISIMGIDQSMPDPMIVGVVADNGYTCRQGADLTITCGLNDRRIAISHGAESERVILFNCETFQGCDYTLDQQLEFVQGLPGMPQLLNLQGAADPFYCGEGEDGDRVCLDSEYGLWLIRTPSMKLQPAMTFTVPQDELEHNQATSAAPADMAAPSSVVTNKPAEPSHSIEDVKQYISRSFMTNWVAPIHSSNNATAKIQVSLFPDGIIGMLEVMQSSGDEEFDDAAVQAVRRIGRLPRIDELDATTFEQNFSHFVVRFGPDGVTW